MKTLKISTALMVRVSEIVAKLHYDGAALHEGNRVLYKIEDDQIELEIIVKLKNKKS